jgi:hypothetical protein
MHPHSFSKRQIAAIALMLDEEEKNVAPSDKKKRMWVHKCFRSRKFSCAGSDDRAEAEFASQMQFRFIPS